MNKEKAAMVLGAAHIIHWTGPLAAAAAVTMILPIVLMVTGSAVKRKAGKDE